MEVDKERSPDEFPQNRQLHDISFQGQNSKRVHLIISLCDYLANGGRQENIAVAYT